jgi:hypothetical protein
MGIAAVPFLTKFDGEEAYQTAVDTFRGQLADRLLEALPTQR